MASTPQFAASIVSSAVNINTANANRDGTGVVGVVVTSTGNGIRIDDLSIKARVTTTAGMIRLFIHNGTAFFLWREILVPAITASATVAAWETQLNDLGLCLASGWSLRASTEKGESFDVTVTRGGAL